MGWKRARAQRVLRGGHLHAHLLAPFPPSSFAQHDRRSAWVGSLFFPALRVLQWHGSEARPP
eukprot:1902335-Prorocentrum_lima.AAC.1